MENPNQRKVKRLHCEFGTCGCVKYKGSRDGRCKICGHGSVWHKLTYVEKKKTETYYDANECPS